MDKPSSIRRWFARRRPLLLPILAVAIATGILWWRQRPPHVQVATPVRRDVVTSVVTTGIVETVTLSPASAVGGRIEELRARRGQWVRKGELLAVLDTRELEARRREAEAALASAQLRAADTSPEAWAPQIEQVEAAVAQARLRAAQARREWRDLQALAEGGAVPRVEAERARDALRAAELQQREAESRLAQTRRQARSQQRQAAAEVEAAKAALATIRTQIDHARIVAPATGVVTEIHAHAGETLAPGAPLLRIARRDGLRIAVHLDEQNLGRVRPGQAARLAADAFPDRTFGGHVEKIDPAVDPERGTIKVLVVPETVPPFLRPEMTLDVTILTGRYPDMLTIPRTALDGTAARPRVWVVTEQGRAMPRPVEPGPAGGAATGAGGDVPIQSGLSPGDRVILNPSRLRPGQRVAVGNG